MIGCALWHFTCSTDRHSSSSPHLSSYFRSCWPRYLSLSLSTWRRSLVCVLCVICAGWILCRECIRPPAYTHTHAFRRRKTCRPWCGVGGWVGEYRPPLMAARIRKKEESSAPAAPIMVLSRAHRVPVSSSVWSNIDVVSFHPFLFFNL